MQDLILRFSFLQEPKDKKLSSTILPDFKEQEKIKEKILDYLISQDSSECKVKLIDVDNEEKFLEKKEQPLVLQDLFFQQLGMMVGYIIVLNQVHQIFIQ